MSTSRDWTVFFVQTQFKISHSMGLNPPPLGTPVLSVARGRCSFCWIRYVVVC